MKFTPSSALSPNRWYPDFKGTGRSYKNKYPTPQSVLRASVGATEYKFLSETVTTEHIRAAVIMPKDVPFAHLLNAPWALTYTDANWRMVIVSILDPVSWIDIARASGAIAWMKSHNQAHVFYWQMHDMDKHNLKIRPPNALGIGSDSFAASGRKTTTKGRVFKGYDKEALIDDIREDLMTYTDIGTKWGVSRITVMKLAKEAGIRKRAPHHGQIKA